VHPDRLVDFRARFVSNRDQIRAEILTRSTQTNEPARCAVLLPVLARLNGPLALIEVGASRDFVCCRIVTVIPMTDTVRLDRNPAFPCRAGATTPVPSAHPRIAWRAGIDLNPLDIHDDDARAWLETLVWPDQPERLARLHAATEIARADPPRIISGDLLSSLPSLAAEAPKDATLVVFHTAVLAYVTDPEARARFARTVRDLNAIWISNEVPGVFQTSPPGSRSLGHAARSYWR